MNRNRQNKGITLIALVITIILLLVLAGISIQAITNTGLFEKMEDAKEEYSKSEAKERIQLEVHASYNTLGQLDLEQLTDNITKNIKGATIEGDSFPIIVTIDGEKFIVKENGEISYDGEGSTGGSDPETPPADPTLPTNPATTITEAQSDYMFTKTVNSPIEDANGNKITIPAGFKIKVGTDTNYTNNVPTADKGIVIIDSDENEFVWIPVPELVEGEGRLYTNTEKTEYKTVELNRYTFDYDGNPTPQNDAVIDSYCEELQTPSNGNAPAKSITNFKQSVTNNKGYYIGRYEARKNSNGTITEKGTDTVWNSISQTNASTAAKDMYPNDKPFTSDLMNSYAWDTAILFLQECGTNDKYSRQNSVNKSRATTGTNDTTNYTGTQDVQCNVYDMAGNHWEWSTESSNAAQYPKVVRGAYYYGRDIWALQ